MVYSLKTAIFALLALFAYNVSTAQQSSPIADTTWGTGFFIIEDEEGNKLPNSTLEVKALDMEMIVPNKIWNYETSGIGIIDFKLPVVIDTTTISVPELSASSFNRGMFEMYSMNGSLVHAQEITPQTQHIDVNGFSEGVYVFRIQGDNGFQTSGKFFKRHFGSAQWPLSMFLSMSKNRYKNSTDLNALRAAQWPLSTFLSGNEHFNAQQNSFKNGTDLSSLSGLWRAESSQADNWSLSGAEGAIYQVISSKEGYYNDTSEVTIVAGENTPYFFNLAKIPGLPAHQDLVGFALDNNGNPLAGAKAQLLHKNTGELYTVITGSDGKFVFEDMPAQINWGEEHKFVFSAGDVDGRYSILNVKYSTPIYHEDTWTASDTINDGFNVILPEKLSSSEGGFIPANKINLMAEYGSLYDTIYYKYDATVSNAEKEFYEQCMQQYRNDENHSQTFVLVDQLPANRGTLIKEGTNNTNHNPTNYHTPLSTRNDENILHPTISAVTTISANDYKILVHEFKRGQGYTTVGYQSIMDADASVYTEDDKSMGELIEKYHYNIYQTNLTNINIHHIADEFESPALRLRSGTSE